MQSARRIYVYFIAAVSLAVWAFGLMNLLRLALEQFAEALGWREVIGRTPGDLRREVSMYAALVVVALPIWLLHWWLAERAVAQGETGEAERQSVVRTFFFAAVLLVSFWMWVSPAVDLVRFAVLEIGHARETFSGGVPGALAAVIVTSLVWIYHVRMRLRDLRRGTIAMDATWHPRLYRYIALSAGAALLIVGAVQLLDLIGDAVFGTQGVIFAGERWWLPRLADGAASVVAGLAVWSLHWWYTQSVLERGDWFSLSERQSTLRRIYLYGVILVTSVLTLLALSSSLETVLRALLSVPVSSGARAFLRRLIEPPVGAIPFVAFWLFYRQRIRDEARRFGSAAFQDSVSRFYRYGLSLVGLAFTALGAAYLAGILVDLVLGGSRTVGFSAAWWRGQVSQYGAMALVGGAVWLWHWYAIQARRQANPERERWTTSRRFYLYAVLGGSLIATLASFSVILYRLFNLLLNVTPAGGFVSAISAALGVAVIAVALLVYHGLILRRETLARPALETATRAALHLVLSGPTGADFDAELDALRAQLHPGFELHAAAATSRQAPSASPSPEGGTRATAG
ncbi:MAG TPA: DUF5671 domain-containing protein [Nitrolancea sp.]|nr:DUF5671 domain-containing protein [Nitrolancea sp.]